MSRVKKVALHTLQSNAHLTVLPTDKGNEAVVLNTSEYMMKVFAPLDDPAYKTSQEPHTVCRMENYSPHHGVLTSS
jgi:hypothetical protein